MKAAVAFEFVLLALCFAPFAHADNFGVGANTFIVDFVTIGNPGNAADTTGNPNPVGSVANVFRIGKYEISEQMIDKVNALGQLGIGRDDIRGPNKPVTSVSWNDAARFVNWLNTSTGSPPAYKFAVQPGQVGYIVDDDIQLWTPSDAGFNASNPYRNSLAHYFLPSVDEWYKAAYYDPATSDYFNYPTGSDGAPTPVASGTTAGTAVYNGQPSPADIMLAGGLSSFGTMGQGGNVYEWEETDFDLVNGPSSNDRALRGGAWHSFGGFSEGLLSSQRDFIYPEYEGGVIGFRVASIVPEPSALLLETFLSFALLARRHRRQSVS